MNNVGKNLALWVIIALLLVVLFNLFQGPSMRGPVTNLAFSEFVTATDAGQISDVTIKGGGEAEAAARSVLEIGEADYAWNLQVAPEILGPMEAAG